MTRYFERFGATPCQPDENPAEWMLHVTGAAPGAHTDRDWTRTWEDSPECAFVRKELNTFLQSQNTTSAASAQDSLYAVSFLKQFLVCTRRVAEQYWRTPTYIYAKILLCLITVS